MLKKLKQINIPMLLVSVVAGAFIRFIVMGTINPEMTIRFQDVSVTIQGTTELYENMGYSILSNTDFAFDVELTGNRNSILRLNRENIEIVCDVSKISGNGANRIQCTVTTPYSDVHVTDQSALMVTIEADKITERSFPLRYELTGTVGDSYSLGTPTLAASTVTVSGPTTELSKISHGLVTANVSELEDSATLSLPVTLISDSGDPIDLRYTQLITKSAELTVPVYLVKEVPFSLRVNSGGGLTENEVELTINPTKVTLVGERAALSEISSISLGSIDLGGIGDGLTTETEFVLPSGIRCRSDRSSATVSVAVKDIEIRSYRVSKITLIGSLDEFNASVLTDYVTVRLRGNATLLDAVTADDFTVPVALATLPPRSGNQMASAEVSFLPAVNAELLEADYSVTVTLRRVEPPSPPEPEE
jgi:YbbR domain-containing protein